MKQVPVIYEPRHTDAKVRERLKAAREKNAQHDAIDGRPFVEIPLPLQLSAVIEALCLGLATDDWEPVAEATAMIQEIGARTREPALA